MPRTAQEKYQFRHRILPALIAVVVVLIYVLRLFYLQLLSPEYKAKAIQNAFYENIIYPERGTIFDRNGSILVYNQPAYDLMVVNHEVSKELDTLALCQVLKIDLATMRDKMARLKDRTVNPGYTPYTPQLLLSKIGATEAGSFQEQLFRFPGFSLRAHSMRVNAYPNAALLIGYMGETSPNDLERDSSLLAGEYIGKSGVERSYDSYLRGVKGTEILLRDSRGRIRGNYKDGAEDTQAVRGRNLTLSIDMELQAMGEKLMQGKRGAIVMIEPATGEVLCLVSAPSYDATLLNGKEMGKNHHMLETMPGKPLFNRAIQGTYPPGSTFKPSHAAVLLQEGVITTETRYSCAHGYPLLHGHPACHGHPSPIPVVFSLATSCNAFYCWGLHDFLDDRKRYPTIQEAFEVWKNRMVKLGLGYKLQVDLPGEKRGYLPNSQVYDKAFKGKWTSASIISISIGQGEILLTPLQMCNTAAIIANRGYYYRPHVVKEIENTPLDTLYTHPLNSQIDKPYWDIVAEGMAQAVTGGTCRAANFAPGQIAVCGKTGTAQNGVGRDHSAFIGFAPKDNPQVCIAVYVENGGFGATYGVPIGRVMMEYYLRKGALSAATQGIASRIAASSIHYLER